MAKRRAADLTNSSIIDQLCEDVISKLTKRATERLTLNQQVTGSSPVRLISFRAVCSW